MIFTLQGKIGGKSSHLRAFAPYMDAPLYMTLPLWSHWYHHSSLWCALWVLPSRNVCLCKDGYGSRIVEGRKVGLAGCRWVANSGRPAFPPSAWCETESTWEVHAGAKSGCLGNVGNCLPGAGGRVNMILDLARGGVMQKPLVVLETASPPHSLAIWCSFCP